MARRLTQRQHQAIALACPTPAHQTDPSLHQWFPGRTPGERFSTTFYVAPHAGRVYWCCTVRREVDGELVRIALCSQADVLAMRDVGVSVFRSDSRSGEMDGPLVGVGAFKVETGEFSLCLANPMTPDEVELLDAGWENRPCPKFPEAHLLGKDGA